ncbi:MFS transporter [Kribbella sp. CA-293567]|uniref:MFS transporter n=1 Tax=Kribbella sp. CA-293567 TaxID=3002436 RepID=UPI0022DE6625|nr:MFS transporter [Kribbella sp. CA-293567]WBQ07002.1 MFS transporter [Kribbella sp. CA-293567]
MLLRYLTAATLARVGDEMVAFTLVLLVLQRTDSAVLAGVTGAAYAFPAIVTGPLLGAWLDRTQYRRTALALNQAVLGAVMVAMLAVVGHSAHWVTPMLAAVAGTTLPLVSGGFTSMLPSLAPREGLPRANSLEAASFGAATITGPAAAATITAVASVEAAAVVIAVTAALSVLAIGRLPALPAGDGPREPFLSSVVAGLVHLARTPRLRASTVTTTLLMGVTGMLLITLPLHMESLGMPRSAAGYLWAALELGSVATALLLGRFQTRWRPEQVVMLVVAAYGLAFTAWPLAGSFAVLLVLAVATGLVEGPMLPAMFGARQVYSPVALQGRVSTTAASLRVGAAALGQATAGLLVPRVGTHTALLLVAGGLMAASGAGWLAGRLSGAAVSTDQGAAYVG